MTVADAIRPVTRTRWRVAGGVHDMPKARRIARQPILGRLPVRVMLMKRSGRIPCGLMLRVGSRGYYFFVYASRVTLRYERIP